MIYKPRSYVRIQDISLTYNIPASLIQRVQINDMQLFHVCQEFGNIH
jgi:TonB-dependent starch-binding outer membrane protein SusC